MIALGPLTNIALLYKLYPDISSKLKNLWMMGGNHLGRGNVSKCAEFNFWVDPEAAHIVFAESKCKIFVFPWEPCISGGALMPFDGWRIDVLSSNNNKLTNLLDPVEIKAYREKLPNWTPCDNFLASCFICPKLIAKSEKVNITVELTVKFYNDALSITKCRLRINLIILQGNHTRGLMVIDHLKKSKPNAVVIEKIDVDLFKKFMLWVCHHDNHQFEF